MRRKWNSQNEISLPAARDVVSIAEPSAVKGSRNIVGYCAKQLKERPKRQAQNLTAPFQGLIACNCFPGLCGLGYCISPFQGCNKRERAPTK